MSLPKTLILGALALAACLTLLLCTHEWGIGRGKDGAPNYQKVLEDSFDRYNYEQRGHWLPAHGVPYVDVYSEYPQVQTWFFGLPYLLFDARVERGEPFGSERAAKYKLQALGAPQDVVDNWLKELPASSDKLATRERLLVPLRKNDRGGAEAAVALQSAWDAQARVRQELDRNARTYGNLHQVLMGLCYFAIYALVALLLRQSGHNPVWALWLFLPGLLYFVFNRNDALVVAELLFALWLQLRGRALWACVVLGVAKS